MQPHEIETKSFEMIEKEAGAHGFDGPEWDVVRRMIHTSADFDYIESARIHPRAIEAGIKAIQTGRRIITDTNMVLAGLRKTDLERFGCRCACLMTDPQVAAAAEQNRTTRALAAVDAAAEIMRGGIYVVGNAPTALMRLLFLVEEGRPAPALVVGLPVGFVNAAESKAELAASNIPHITNAGRKGGSNVAAAVINSLVIQATENRRGK